MHTEIEAKFLDVDVSDFVTKLKDAGGVLQNKQRLMRRKTFDYPDGSLGKKGGWVRVRDEGDKVTVSYKQLEDRTLHGTKEVNLTVDNFESAIDFLQSVGLVVKSYQETKRESWKLGDTEVEIDTWPWVPSFVELESPNEADIINVAKRLGLDWSKALHGSVEIVYQKYYDVTEQEVINWKEIVFSDVPKFLKKLKRS